MSVEAPLAEVFVSFQGEGPLVGVRQLFVRVRGCDLTCLYCDTPAAREVDGPCRIECEPGSGQSAEIGNPLTAEALLAACGQRLLTPALHSVALTGGEPLLYPDFVRELAQAAQAWGLPLYLETAGHRPTALAEVADHVDFVSLDFKLPSTLRAPVDTALFAESYRTALGRLVAVKMVVTAQVVAAEVREACRLLAQVSSRGPLVLQPVTEMRGGPTPPGPQLLHEVYHVACEHLADVRVIPQCHRLMGVR